MLPMAWSAHGSGFGAPATCTGNLGHTSPSPSAGLIPYERRDGKATIRNRVSANADQSQLASLFVCGRARAFERVCVCLGLCLCRKPLSECEFRSGV